MSPPMRSWGLRESPQAWRKPIAEDLLVRIRRSLDSGAHCCIEFTVFLKYGEDFASCTFQRCRDGRTDFCPKTWTVVQHEFDFGSRAVN